MLGIAENKYKSADNNSKKRKYKNEIISKTKLNTFNKQRELYLRFILHFYRHPEFYPRFEITPVPYTDTIRIKKHNRSFSRSKIGMFIT